MLEIRAGGLVILGRPAGHGLPRGLFVGPGGFQGWDDAPAGRRAGVDRPTAHGSFDVPVWRGERVVTIDGPALAYSESELGHLRSRVTGLGSDGRRVRLTVDHQGKTLWADGRVVEATFRDSGARGRRLHAKFSLQIVAADMRKYGPVVAFPGASVQAFHYGNFPSAPVIEVAGPVAAPYTVASQGRSYTVTQALTSGQTHRIDMATGWLYRNGVLQTGAVSSAQTFEVPPGQPVAVTGPASMTVKVTDTYI